VGRRDATRGLHRLPKATNISRLALHVQFGSGFKAVRQFKPRFTEALEAALAAYPEARVDLNEKAITLHPARPPIPTKIDLLAGEILI